MKIAEYFACGEQSRWLEKIQKSDWSAGQYLYELLRDHKLKKLCGENTRVLMLTDGEDLVSFCTYAEQDDVREPSLTPWVGFVYTFPAYRGKRHMGKLLDYADMLAREESRRTIYISTGETGLYEKYGYSFWKIMKDINGEDSRIYRKEVQNSKREGKGMLPKDPMILLSYVNTKLRDEYSSLVEFCGAEDTDQAELTAKLAEIGYQYDGKENRFH